MILRSSQGEDSNKLLALEGDSETWTTPEHRANPGFLPEKLRLGPGPVWGSPKVSGLGEIYRLWASKVG